MDRLQAMSVFVEVVDAGGFARAARRLNLSPPAVTRAVAELEERLALRLLTRTTRHVRVTEVGARYADECRRILEAVRNAEAAAQGAHEHPYGTLTLTAPVLFGRLHVAGIVTEYLARHAEVNVNCLFSDRVLSIMEDRVDVAVRIAELPDSSLKAVRVGQVRRMLVAAPAYLAAHGTPTDPDDLAGHTLLGTGLPHAPQAWRFGDGASARVVPVRLRLQASNNDTLISAACGALGIARVVSYQAAAGIRSGELVPLLEGHEPPPLPVSVVRAPGPRPAPTVRAFVDLAVERLRAQLAD